jgi:3-oxoacyl-[acyl-carrier protein] reductase
MTSGRRFEDRVAIVTGGARGMGLATARLLGREGATVTVVDLLGELAETAARSVESEGGRALAATADVTSPEQVEDVVERVVSQHGQLDVLVNCAGIFVLNTPLISLAERDWRRLLDVNVTGTFLPCKYAGQVMARQDSGAIVNFSSVSSFAASWGTGAYSASKAAINLLTKALALELGPYGVRVNAVAPGFVETDLNREQIADPAVRDGFLKYFPLHRFGQPADIAEVVAFLASPAASYVNGTVVTVDAGWTTHYPNPNPYPEHLPTVSDDLPARHVEESGGST